MPFETERRIHDNPPTPEQLHTLASIGVRSAVSRERFKTLQRTPNAHYFVDELDLLTDVPTLEDDMPTQVRHRMAMRVGARPPQDRYGKVWSLKYLDTYFAEDTLGEWRAERSTYSFEWTRGKVLVADRSLRLVGFESPYDSDDLETQLDHFQVRDDAAAILQAQEELRTVTEADCDELIKDMSEYFTVIDAVNR